MRCPDVLTLLTIVSGFSVAHCSAIKPASLSARDSIFAALTRRSPLLSNDLEKRETAKQAQAKRIREAKKAAAAAARAARKAAAIASASVARAEASSSAAAVVSSVSVASVQSVAAASSASASSASAFSATFTPAPAPAPTSAGRELQAPVPTPVASISSSSAAAESTPIAPVDAGNIDAVKAAIKKTRCGSDKACAHLFAKSGSTLPPGGAALCNLATRVCTIGCANGFHFGPDGITCVTDVTACGVNACGSLANGFYTCSGNAACTPNCDANLGFTLATSASGTAVCVNTAVNPAFCGANQVVCPPSYNNVGTAKCSNGACSLACPAGTGRRNTLSTGAAYCG